MAILPIDLRLTTLSKMAALSLLSIPHSSQLIQRLGPPWCSPLECKEGHVPLPHPIPNTPLIRLANRTPHQARHPANYQHGPWMQLTPNRDLLQLIPATPHGEDRKQLAESLIHSTKDRQDALLLIFCQGSCPSSPEGEPISIASCVAWQKGRKIKHSSKIIGHGADTADAAIEAVILTLSLATSMLPQLPSTNTIKILSTNAYIPRLCATHNHRDLSPCLITLSTSLTDFLDRFQLPTSVSWSPIAKGLVTTFPLSLPQPMTGPTPVPRTTAETLIYNR